MEAYTGFWRRGWVEFEASRRPHISRRRNPPELVDSVSEVPRLTCWRGWAMLPAGEKRFRPARCSWNFS